MCPDRPFVAETRTVGSLLTGSGTGFYIPLYQRPYRWNKDNAGRLIADVVDGISTYQETRRSSTFLGTLITVPDSDLYPPATDRPPTVFQVIDGQQRIATLLGMFGELNRAAHSAFNSLNEGERQHILPFFEPISQKLSKSLCLTSSATDQFTLPRMIRGGVDQWGIRPDNYKSEIGSYLATYDLFTVPQLTEDMSSFNDVLSTMRDSFVANMPFEIDALSEDQWKSMFEQRRPSNMPTSETVDRLLKLLAFASFSMNRVHVIWVQANHEESASAIFESLNTTGERLTALETFVPLVVSAKGGQASYAGSLEETQIKRFRKSLTGLRSKEITPRTKTTLVGFALSDTGRRLGERLYVQRAYLREYKDLGQEERQTFITGLGNTASCLRQLWYGEHPLPRIIHGTC